MLLKQCHVPGRQEGAGAGLAHPDVGVGRQDLVQKETAEQAILLGYLPAAPDAAEVERVVAAVIAEVGASGPKDLGRVMKPALERLGAGVDGKLVSQTARRLLGGS